MSAKNSKFVLWLFLLAACVGGAPNYQMYLARRGISEPSPDSIPHCRGYGCQYIDQVTLSPQEWQRIENSFKKPAKNPAREREQIAQAIGTFEQIIGAITKSNEDVAGTFEKTGTYQLDCVDESTNTTIYLAALQAKGALKFHTLEAPTVRFPLIHSGTWPHQTAVIRERESGNYYAVDSWFHDNGAVAEIIPLDKWKDGWEPDER